MNAERLADALQQAGYLKNERVAAAFRAVPRHLFLPNIPTEIVYSDVPVYTRTDDQGAFLGGSDAPRHVARMLSQAQLEPGMNVLEIGTGTGYNAALIQTLVGDEGRVTTLEIDPQAAEAARDNLQRSQMGQVHVVTADGAAGYDQRASYDRIISTVAIWDIPAAWMRQLRPGGLIITPVFLDGLQVCATLEIMPNGDLFSDTNTSCAFVGIMGYAAPPLQHLYLGGGSSLRIYSNEATRIDSAALHLLMLEDAEHCHLGSAPSQMDYWEGFVPYMMLTVSPDYDFVCYAVLGAKNVYGLSESGFALIAQGSATFVGAEDMGDTHCYAGVDAFMEIVAKYGEWQKRGQPNIKQMRLRFGPRDEDDLTIPQPGRVYARREHDVSVWLAQDEHPQ